MDLIDKKQVAFVKVLRGLARETVFNEYMGRTRLLQGGSWREKMLGYLQLQIEPAFEDVVDLVEFEARVERWAEGVLKGCNQVKKLLEQKKPKRKAEVGKT